LKPLCFQHHLLTGCHLFGHFTGHLFVWQLRLREFDFWLFLLLSNLSCAKCKSTKKISVKTDEALYKKRFISKWTKLTHLNDAKFRPKQNWVLTQYMTQTCYACLFVLKRERSILSLRIELSRKEWVREWVREKEREKVREREKERERDGKTKRQVFKKWISNTKQLKRRLIFFDLK